MFASPWQLLIVLVLVVLLFGGRGRLSSIMGDLAKGITSFKKGLNEGADEAKDAADDAIDVTPPKAKSTVKNSKKG